MHHLLYIIIISLTNNLDNLGVRIAYSMRGIKMTHPINLWISVLTFTITMVAAYLGAGVSGWFDHKVSSVIVMMILVVIGLQMIWQSCRTKNNVREVLDEKNIPGVMDVLVHPEKGDRDHSKNIEFGEATLLGIALSLNNIGGGFSAGMLGLNIFWVGLSSALFSFLALWGGNYVAEYCEKKNLSDRATVIAGLVLIVIGIAQVF